MLFIKIKNLHKNVYDRDWLSKNDLYVKLQYGNKTKRTCIIWNNNLPNWDEDFVFEVNKNDKLKISIYDADVYSKDEILEEYVIPIHLGKIKDIETKCLNIKMGDLMFESNCRLNTKILKLEKLSKTHEILKKELIKLNNKIKKIKELLV